MVKELLMMPAGQWPPAIVSLRSNSRCDLHIESFWYLWFAAKVLIQMESKMVPLR
jgi:hypothetical protein